MSYTELENGYQDLRHANRPSFYVGEDGNLIPMDRGDIDLCGDPSDGIDSDGSVSSCSGKQVVVGVCAMAKKSQSKPMKEILTRVQEFEYIRIVVFTEEVILKDPVENWPICDCLISFHSKGFPLEKAVHYAQLRRPYVINNLHMQFDIQDRRKVYAILDSEGIEIPRYAVLDRDSPDPKQHELVESEDHVEVNGVIFNKPFVEKPVSAEDHNIYIYYPTSAGGGSQRLFRKIGSRSSVYSPESRVRKTGSFIYEDFMPTDGNSAPVLRRAYSNLIFSKGTDVKVYTVGPDYAHAEARKSPALDGKVERDSEGKEIRYPVILSNAEKLISRKVCLAFKQCVCGFDLLRANGKSYVCDVNGFSFVKNSNKYYDDCAKILGNMILRELAPTLHIPWSVPFQLDDPPIVPTTFGKMMELRCVVAVIRHGDRTPKQKMKVEVRHPKFFEIFEKYDGYKHGHVKLKRPKQLQEILDIARSLLAEIQTKSAEAEIEEKQSKLEQLKSVLEMYGHFSGINRKVQMKYQPKGRPRGSSSDDGNNSDVPKEPSLVLILKWGGELTPAGRIQAEELGRIFRCMYPGGQGRHEYTGTQGLGLLRLHSTFRHDLKIYASDEGRVQMTAAAFAKGLLALEGELTPILVQMVKSANTNGLLDNDCDSSKYQNLAKSRLHELMQIDRDFTAADRDAINPGNSMSINQALDFVKNPFKCCGHVQALIQSLLSIIAIKRDDPKTRDAVLYHGETWELMGRRWGKIEKDFSTKTKMFDISKIPDIYDCIKYDLQHNQHTLQFEQAEELYLYAKYLADVVIPQEYGLTMPEKLTIGQGICTPLLKKIKADLQRNIEELGDESVNRLNPRYSHGVSSPGRHVRTRLYFTSESHVHSLLTVLRHGGLLDVLTDEQWRRAMEYVSMVSELNYMSQIVIMLYEDPTKDPFSEERFHVELHFSPGVNCCVQKNLPPGPGFRPHSRNDSVTSKNASGEEDQASTRIEEESDTTADEESSQLQTDSSVSPQAVGVTKLRSLKVSEPISIGSCHTVSGHEAMDLAKRLSEELASQQSTSYGAPVSFNAEQEMRSRSFENRHSKTKAKMHTPHNNSSATKSPRSSLFGIESATNELPLSAINFSMSSQCSTPDILIHAAPTSSSVSPLDGAEFPIDSRPCMSPSATNERPLSSACLKLAVQVPEVMATGDNGDVLGIRTASDSVCPSPHVIRRRGSTGIHRSYSGDKSHCLMIIDSDNNPFNNHIHNHIHNHNHNHNRNRNLPSERFSLANESSLLTLTDAIDYQKSFALSQSTIDNLNLTTNTSLSTTTTTMQTENVPTTVTTTQTTTTTTTQTTTTTENNNQKYVKPKYLDKHKTTTSTQSTLISPSTTTTTTTTSSSSSTQSSTTTIIVPSTTAASTTLVAASAIVRRQRHSIAAGQMSYYKMLGFGGFGKKLAGTTSTNSLFSTAVISGSSSAPNLRDMIPCTASPSALEGFGGVPPIRPLETLHNALSLKQLDTFLERMTSAPLFKTPASSPPKYPSTPLPTPTQTPHNSLPDRSAIVPLSSWSGQSSMTSSISAMSSAGPSSPNISEMFSRGCSSSDMSASIASNDGFMTLDAVRDLSQFFPKLDDDLVSVGAQLAMTSTNDGLLKELSAEAIQSGENTPISESSEWEFNTNDATKGSTSCDFGTEEEEEETTLSTDTCLSLPGDLNITVDQTLTSVSAPRLEKSFSLGGRFSPYQRTDFSRFINVDSPLTSGTPRSEHSPIQKQISLCDSERSTYGFAKMTLAPPQMSASEDPVTPTPGTIVVREIYIDPPKRVANSFHGKTKFLQHLDRRASETAGSCSEGGPNAGGCASSSAGCIPKVLSSRFTTTLVKEASQEEARSSSATANANTTSECGKPLK